MHKGNGSINSYKGGLGNNVSNSNSHSGSKKPGAISASALDHSSKGNYNTRNRPTGGGHGQEAIDYMNANGIPYEINKEFANGVRAGNLPTHKNAMFHTGNRHTWFPRTWTRETIKRAGSFVASQYKGPMKAGARHSANYLGVNVTVIFGENGTPSTIYPTDRQPGGKKK